MVLLRAFLSLLALLAAPLAGAVSATGGLATPADVPAAAVASAPSVNIVPNFRVGETLRLRIEKSGFVEVQGKAVSRQHQGTPVTLRVLAHDSRGTRIECIYGPGELLDGTDQAVRDNPVLRLMLASREGMRIRIATGPRFGNPRVENAAEVLARFRVTLAKAVAIMPPDVGPAVQRLVEPMLANPDAFALKLAEEILAWTAVIGVDVPLQGALVASSETPAITGSAPVRTWGALRVERHDPVARRVTLGYRQGSNPDDVRAAADGLVAGVRGEAGQDAAAAAAAVPPAAAIAPAPANPATVPGLHVSETGRYEVDLATGWPDSSRRERIVQFGDQRIVEETRVERLP